mmetsp:Transcript_55187/g.145678  ORF Transcript_55187/g.145678 Transcript_55187/m.145678 type:complete len:190 (+) Transcript_55187:734-1303(+)
MDEDTDVLKFNRKPVKVMTAAQFDEKYGARPYLQKNLRDWAFQDVLDFFRRSVTNDRKCIELITTREVDGSIIDKLNDDEEMARTLNMQPIHVRKFRIKMKQVQELFNREGLSLEERELKETLKANKLGIKAQTLFTRVDYSRCGDVTVLMILLSCGYVTILMCLLCRGDVVEGRTLLQSADDGHGNHG